MTDLKPAPSPTVRPRFIAGVDPGLGGAIAFYDHLNPLDGDCLFTIFDMPTLEIRTHGKLRRRIDEDALARLVQTWAPARHDPPAPGVSLAVIEKVGPSPRDGVAGAFAFGDSFGQARMAFAANFVPRHYVAPVKWKRALGLTSDKDASRALASRMFPAAAHLWSRKKDDGRAEAALLAWYGSKLKERGEV